jgi:hypothetical protein
MPASVMRTPGRPPQNLYAHDASESRGLYAFIKASAFPGITASVPPLQGSMTTIGLLCFMAISYDSLARMDLFIQST